MSKMIISILVGMCLLADFVTITAASTDYLIESDHSYANNFVYTWPEISQPGATQIRLHFTKLELADDHRDIITFLDKDGNELGTWNDRANREDYWTSWYTGDTIKVRLETNEDTTAYGFKIDQIETRTDMAPSVDLPESYHPYANNFVYTWPEISQPGATQIRLHFTKLELADDHRDIITFLDKDGNELGTWNDRANREDYWTEWYTGDTIKVRLETNGHETAYGFKIDQIETRENLGYAPTEETEYTPTEETEYTPTEETEYIPTEETEYTPTEETEYIPTEEPETFSASVNLYGEKTEVIRGEDVLLKLSAVNLITNPTMHVQAIIIPPSGMSVSSTEFVESGAGQYTTTYEIEPGKGRDIEVRIAANQVGNFNVNGRIVYYFGESKKSGEDYTLNLPIQVEASVAIPTPEPMTIPTPEPTTTESKIVPGLGVASLIFILLVVFLLIRN